MKHLNSPFVLLALNASNSYFEEKCIARLGLPYKVLTGSYKGVKERSYLVLVSSDENSFAVDMDKISRIKDLAWEYNQECVLFVDAQRLATVIYPNGKTVEVGKYVREDKAKALLQDAWTYDFTADQYWVTKDLKDVTGPEIGVK